MRLRAYTGAEGCDVSERHWDKDSNLVSSGNRCLLGNVFRSKGIQELLNCRLSIIGVDDSGCVKALQLFLIEESPWKTLNECYYISGAEQKKNSAKKFAKFTDYIRRNRRMKV